MWRSATRLRGSERRGAARALTCLAAARLALWSMPYAVIRRGLANVPERSPSAARMTAADCGRAVERAGCLMLRAGCLARAVAAEWLLRRDGHAADLSLGVLLDDRRRLTAHAWVESNGVMVIGGGESLRYKRLTSPRP